MSTLANQEPKKRKKRPGNAGPMSAKLAKFGVPVPPRIAQFFDGPELAEYDGVRAWGLEGWASDTKMKVKWASPRLADIHEYASECEFEEDASTKYLPIAALGSESHMFVVDITSDQLPVCFFDYESGFKPWAPDFEAFLKKLLKKGERTPGEKLTKAYEQARALHAESRYEEMIAGLEPVVAQFPTKLDYSDDARDTVGAAWNLLGIAYEKRPDIPKAMHAYEVALELGTDSAGLNICDLWLNEFKDYAKLVAFAEERRTSIWRMGSDAYAWFHIRNYLGQGYLLVGRPSDAIRAYHQIGDLAMEDAAKVAEAVKDLRTLIAERAGVVDRITAEAILEWLDVPAPQLAAEAIAGWRAWWTALPEKATEAIREALHFEGEPGDGDLARVAAMTSLDVKNAELADIAWVTRLDRLEDLDFEGNKLTDISALATLVRLRKLDISENQIANLRPLAPLVRLERLSTGENPLAGLEGLEGMRRLNYLHVNEAGVTSVEPLRGLPELVDVTVYNNAIQDLSPLAESPRIKKISSFGNPLSKGLPALAVLPWLESVEAGDASPPADVKALHAAAPTIEIDHYYPDDDADSIAEPEPGPDPELRAWWHALPAVWREALAKEFDRDERGKAEPSDEALHKLVREDSLHFDDRPLPDLEPLRRFDRLDYVNVANTGTVDLTAVAALPRLRDLLIRRNPLTSLAPLARALVLEELYMETCRVTSLAGLERCFTLRELYAEDNRIEDLGPIGELDQLRELDFEGNRLTTIAVLAKLPRLHTVKLGLNRITDLAPLAACRELRVVEIWANPGLRNGIALADLPELARLITHGSLAKAELDELRRRRPDLVLD